MRSNVVAFGNLGTISAFACRHRETKKNLCRGGKNLCRGGKILCRGGKNLCRGDKNLFRGGKNLCRTT